MIITPHLLLGAAIGAKTQNLGLTIILGLISHLVLDKIPHWDYGNKEIKKFTESKSYKDLLTFFLKLLIDGLTGLIIVIFIIWHREIVRLEYLILILIGMFVAILPDILLMIFKLPCVKSKKPSKNFIDFYQKTIHHSKHIRKPTLIGLGTEILISLIAVLIMIL